MDCAKGRIGGEEVSTDNSLNFCCEWIREMESDMKSKESFR